MLRSNRNICLLGIRDDFRVCGGHDAALCRDMLLQNDQVQLQGVLSRSESLARHPCHRVLLDILLHRVRLLSL